MIHFGYVVIAVIVGIVVAIIQETRIRLHRSDAASYKMLFMTASSQRDNPTPVLPFQNFVNIRTSVVSRLRDFDHGAEVQTAHETLCVNGFTYIANLARYFTIENREKRVMVMIAQKDEQTWFLEARDISGLIRDAARHGPVLEKTIQGVECRLERHVYDDGIFQYKGVLETCRLPIPAIAA